MYDDSQGKNNEIVQRTENKEKGKANMKKEQREENREQNKETGKGEEIGKKRIETMEWEKREQGK